MAPKESPASKAARLQRKAVQLQNKASMERVKALLQNRPELVQATLTHLENLLDQQGMDMKTPTKAARSSTPDSASQRSMDGIDDSGSAVCDDVPACYSSIEELSVKHLKQILFKCEPIAFGPFAIRALAKRGAREVAKQNLTQLIEYITGVEPSVTINGEERKFTHLIQRLVDLSDERGNLGRTLQLPPNWAEQGYYKIASVDPVTITNKAGVKVQVADDFLPDDIDAKSLYISTNWSEKRATLEAEGTFLNQTLYILFAPTKFNKKRCASAPQAKKDEPSKQDDVGDKRHKQCDQEDDTAKTAGAASASELGVSPPPPPSFAPLEG